MTTILPLQARRNGLLAWWREGTPEGRRALIAAALGWMLDSFDVMLYALVLSALIPDLGMSKETAGLLGSVSLLAAAAGGVLFETEEPLLLRKLGRFVTHRPRNLIRVMWGDKGGFTAARCGGPTPGHL